MPSLMIYYYYETLTFQVRKSSLYSRLHHNNCFHLLQARQAFVQLCFPCDTDLKDEYLFQVPPLENQISTVEKEMRTTPCREVDLIKSEKRKRGDGDPWLVSLNNHLLCIFLKPPPASSTIAMHPFRPCSALSAGHSPSSQTPHPHGCALQRQNTVPCSFPQEALRHLVQEPSMSTCTFNI